MNKNIKKTFALAAGALVLGMGAVGCTDVDKQVNEKLTAQQKVSDLAISELQEQIALLKNTAAVKEIDTEKIAKIEAEIATALSDKKLAEDEVARIKAEYEAVKLEAEQEVVAKVCDKLIEKKFDESLATTLDSKDVDKLFKGEIKFDGERYDVEEKLIFSDDLKVGLSSTHDEEFGANAYLIMEASGAIEYKYLFKDVVALADITANEPLKIDFLGKALEIIDIDATGMTVREGVKKLVTTGDSFEINGKTVTIKIISEDGIGVEVNGEFEIIDDGDSEKVNDVDILVEEVIASSKESATDYATIIVGEDSEKDIDVGDEYVEDADNWVWDIQTSGTDLVSIGVKWDIKVDELDDDYKPVAIGETLNLPEDYLSIRFDSLINADYDKVTVDFKDFGTNDVNTAKFTADDDIFYVNGEYLDEVSFDGTYAYYKEDGDEYKILETIKIINDDMEYKIEFDGANITVGDLSFIPSVETGYGDGFTYLGTDEKDSESTEVKYNGANIGNEENDVLVTDGMVIEDTDANGNKDKVVFNIPSDNVEAVICVN